jgi:organic radical activating enzyme
MKGWEERGKECRGKEDEIFVRTNGCTHRYLYCILDRAVRFPRKK